MSLANSWAYQYDGLGRLRSAQRGTAAATAMTYDGLGNMKTLGGLSFAYASTAPHHISSSTPPGAAPTYEYEPDGGLMSRPDVDSIGADAAHTLEYDADGRVKMVTVNGHTVRSVYDGNGERVARIVDENTAARTVTFFYGRWAEVTGTTLTRHIYLGNRLLAESPIAAGGLSLAALDDPQQRVMLARTLSEAVAHPEQLRPVVALSGSVAIMVAGGTVFLCVGLLWMPGRVRVAVVGRVRRGPLTVLVVLCIATLLPLPRLQPAWAGGGCTNCGGGSPPPPPPVFPVYFVHRDHLGSTTMLTCYKQTGCPDRAVVRYYRYDAYGQVTAYGGDGTVIDVTAALTSAGPNGGAATYVPERLYTGQHWDDAAQLYYYGARFYDPRIANFVTTDPVREYMNPYAYVGWNPVKFTDPTGMLGGSWGLPGGFSSLGYNGFDYPDESAFGPGGTIGGASGGGSGDGGLAGEMVAGALNGQRYDRGGVLFALEAASTDAGVAFAGSFGSASDDLTPVSFIEGVTPPGATNPTQGQLEGPGAVVQALLQRQGLDSVGARNGLLNAARLFVGGQLNRGGQPFYAVLVSTPGQQHDVFGISPQPAAIIFPARATIDQGGFVSQVVELQGTNFGLDAPFLYGPPASIPAQLGLESVQVITVNQLLGF